MRENEANCYRNKYVKKEGHLNWQLIHFHPICNARHHTCVKMFNLAKFRTHTVILKLQMGIFLCIWEHSLLFFWKLRKWYFTLIEMSVFVFFGIIFLWNVYSQNFRSYSWKSFFINKMSTPRSIKVNQIFGLHILHRDWNRIFLSVFVCLRSSEKKNSTISN